MSRQLLFLIGVAIVYTASAGPGMTVKAESGKTVPAGSGKTVKAGSGKTVPAFAGFRQGLWQSFATQVPSSSEIRAILAGSGGLSVVWVGRGGCESL